VQIAFRSSDILNVHTKVVTATGAHKQAGSY